MQADAARPLPFAAGFRCVLLDAPCSGLGTIRRDPDIRWRRHGSGLRRARRCPAPHAGAGRRRSCAPGGRLDLRDLFERARGERGGRRCASCEARPDFRPVSRPDAVAKQSRRWSIASGRLRTLPHRDRPRSVFRGDLGENRGFAVNFKIHGTYDARLERGQAAPARRRAGADLRPLCRRVDAHRAPDARGRRSDADRQDGERGDGRARRGRADAEGRRDPAVGSEDSGGPDPGAGSAGRRPDAPRSAASRSGSAPGRGRASCRRCSANRSARRSCGCSRTAWSWPAISEIRSATTRPTSSSRRRRRRRARAARVSLLVNRGERGATYVMPDLIGVNGDRAADLLRTRGFRVVGRRRPSLSRRAGGHRAPAESAGRLPDRARASRSRSRSAAEPS